MVINTKFAANAATMPLAQSSQLLSKSLAQLSSGLEPDPGDGDPKGPEILPNLNLEDERRATAINNAGSARPFTPLPDHFLQQMSAALSRMSELAAQAQDGISNSSGLALFHQEFQTLAAYVNNVAAKDFKGINLYSGRPLKRPNGADNEPLKDERNG